MGEVVFGTCKEMKALIVGRARARATLPVREEAEINEGTHVSDGGSPWRSAFQGGTVVYGFICSFIYRHSSSCKLVEGVGWGRK